MWRKSSRALSLIFQEREIDREERKKNKKFYKIRVIYYLKWKFNFIGRKIQEKTHNLTQNHARNNPIRWRIKTFHFAFWKTKIRCSRGKIFWFSQQNLTFKHSLDAGMRRILSSQVEHVWRSQRLLLFFSLALLGHPGLEPETPLNSILIKVSRAGARDSRVEMSISSNAQNI